MSTLHELPPTPRQPRSLRAAALLLAASVLLLTGYVVWTGINAEHRADDALTTLSQHDHDAAQDRAAAARDRAHAASEVQALQAKLNTSLASQDVMLRLLRLHGIPVPTRYVTRIERHIIVRHSGPARRVHHRSHRRVRVHRTTTQPAPGKPGHAPGHHKHPRHGHRHR